MANLTLRQAKGSPLTFAEVDGNFTALNNELATATSANTASTPVKRDASGNFSAGTITANLTGTASAIADNTVTSAKIVDGTIVDADINSSAAITLTKLGTGALPTAITVASANIVDGTIVDADINSSAAIAGTKISPNFGSQNVVTTGTVTAGSFPGPVIDGTILEDVFTITDGAAFEVDPANGSVQLITLGDDRTPKATNFAAGHSITLMVDDGSAHTLTWTDTTWGTSGVEWTGGSAPDLATSGYTVIQFWKVGTQVYGALVGEVA
jgi:hypothetical protein